MPDYNSKNKNTVPTYIGAPYNFVSLGEKVVSYNKKELPAHNSFRTPECDRQGEELYSGEIHYTVTAETDIFVGGSNGKEFYRSINGNYALPGSSLRGLVRANMQILGMSSIADDVDDYQLMYRKVADTSSLGKNYSKTLGVKPVPIKKGKSISVCTKVQVGYLIFDGKNYTIAEIPGDPCSNVEDSKQNYYTLRETDIIDEYQKTRRDESKNPYAYLIEIADKHLMYQIDPYPFLPDGNVVRGSNNPHYCPSVYAISFKTSNNYHVEKVGKPGELNGSNCHEGYILSSGFMHKKKTHYIIPAIEGIDMNNINSETLESNGIHSIPLDEKAIATYKRDYEAKKKLLGTTIKGLTDSERKELQHFYELPQKKGACRPVFYVDPDDNEGTIHFGFTPYQRLFYEHTVADGIPKAHKELELDYTQAILGYSKSSSGENRSWKSRVSFEDAELILPKGKTAENLVRPAVSPMLASPKPTSFLDYLTQKELEQVTYNSSDFTLRGYKQYWLHKEAAATQTVKKAEQGLSFQPLESKSTFRGIIRFKNLYADELGLLLWCLRLENNSQQNLGKAKAYGYGRIQIDIQDLKLLDLEKMYDSLTLDFSPYKDSSAPDHTPSASISEAVDQWIQLYKKQISQKLGSGKDIMEEPCIKQFLLMKDSSKFLNKKQIRYMNVDNKDYQNRKERLPFPEEVLGMKSFQKLEKGTPEKCAKTVHEENNRTTEANTDDRQILVKVDGIVTGTVKNIATKKGRGTFGVFVSLPEKHQGLLHESKMAHPLDYYTVGKSIEVKITGITDKGISLTDVGI